MRFSIDTTEMKAMERELLEQANERRGLIDSAGLAIAYYKLDGTVIWFNRAAAANMGGVPDDFAGKNLKEVFPVKDAKVFIDRIEKTSEAEEPLVFEDEIETPTGKFWFRSVLTCILNTETSF